MQRVLAAVVVVVAIAGLTAAAAALGGPGEPKRGEARVSLAEGVVAERRAGVSPSSVWSTLRDGDLVRTGEHVRVRSGGEAVLAFAREVRLTLPAGSELAVGAVPELVSGSLLVETGRLAAQTVDAGESSFAVATSSAARLHRSLDAGTAVYAGRVDVASAGRRLRVPALRAASVPALGLVPAQASPLVLRAADRWDVRFLGAAMDLSAALDAGSAGFSAQAPSVDSSALLSLVPGAASDSGGLLRGRRSGDQLVATAIAAARPDAFSTRLPSVVAFRDQGASWGLVAFDQTSVDERGRLVARVRAAIADWLGRSGGFAASAPASVASSTPTAGAATVAGGSAIASPTASVPSGGGGGSDPSPPPTSPPPTTTPPVTTPPLPTVTLPPSPVTVPVVPLVTGSPIGDVIDAIGLGIAP